MIRKSLGLVLGIVLSLGAMETPLFAYPRRIRTSSNRGFRRSVIVPSGRIGNNYHRRSSYYRGGGYSHSRGRIIIQGEPRGYCYNCGHSNGYNPYRNHGNYRHYRGYNIRPRSVPRQIDYYYYR
ncbi:MAG: hypothetical protein QNJ64_06790 [Crocosphaera sp.]|nr:hypothetical protein [Crocosphaera sp.]